MFNTLKELLLNEIKQEVEEAKKMLDEITSLEIELTYHSVLKNPKEKYSFADRHFIHKKKMAYKSDKQNYLRSIKEDIARRTLAKERLEQLRSEKDNDKLRKIIDRYNNIKEAKNIKELGYTFEQVREVFNKKGIPLVLDETDTIIDNEATFDKLDDLVLVHKTMYAPSGDIIKTTGNVGVTKKEQIVVGDRTLDIEYAIPRQTVHFSVNGEVISHEAGNWDDMKYAIVIPLVDVPNISTFNQVDTFTNGNVDISKGYLLCPVNEVEKIKEQNPNLTVIGYKGNISPRTGNECVTGIADKLISQLGYKHECFLNPSTGGQKWEDDNDAVKAALLVDEKMNVVRTNHNDSKEGIEEDYNIAANQFFSVINGLLQSDIDVDPNLMSKQLGAQLLLTGTLNTHYHEKILTYDHGKFLGKTISHLWKYGTDLWHYGFETPSYLGGLVEATYKKKSIDSVIDKSIMSNEIISDDAMEYIENMKKRDGNNFNVDDCLSELFIYETLKNVQKYKMEKSMQSASPKTM